MRAYRLALAIAVVAMLVGVRAQPAAAAHAAVDGVLAANGISLPGLAFPTSGPHSFSGSATLTGRFVVLPYMADGTIGCVFDATDFGNVGTGAGTMTIRCEGTSTVPPGLPILVECAVAYQRAGSATVSSGECFVSVNGGLGARGAHEGVYAFHAPPPYPAMTFQFAGPMHVTHL